MSTPELVAALAALVDDAAAGVGIAAEPKGKALLRAIGVRVPTGCVVANAEVAVTAAREIGLPVAVKIVAPEVPHKSELGAVRGPLRSDTEVREAAEQLVSAFGAALLVEQWLDGGMLCYVGLRFSAEYGAVVSFGLGGIWVEALRDVSHRLAPVTTNEAVEMVTSLRAAPLFLGERGCPGVDVRSLASAVAKISCLALIGDVAELLSEVEINPLLARTSGRPSALDCSVVLRRKTLEEASARPDPCAPISDEVMP